MTREWQVGDLAMARGDGGEFLVVRMMDGLGLDYWSAPMGWPRGVRADECEYRPLVVIDAESVMVESADKRGEPDAVRELEQCLRLIGEGERFAGGSGRYTYRAEVTLRLADALREFADPKPPTCKAALNINGEHFACDQPEGHGMSHANQAAGAIWGEPS